MFQKLDEVEKRYESLETQLSDPRVTQDPTHYRKLSKEHSDLKPLIGTYRHLKKVEAEIEENKELLKEKDEEMRKMAKDELTRLQNEKTVLEGQLKILLLPKDPNDDKNILLEIRAGTGGEEAALFAADLYRMYSKYAETRGWRVEVMDLNPTGIGGFKEVIVLIAGTNVYSDLKYESGIHRVQRVPKTEASGRIHTSAVTVVVLPEADDLDVQVDEKDLQIDVFRASGPGGQGVNTTDSAVRLTHRPSGLVVVCRDERSQIKNRAKAMKILKSRLLEAEQKRQQEAETKARKSMIGSGDRSEKIRTYNFPQNRLTDHRIGLTLHQLDHVLEGHLEEIIPPLRNFFQAEALQAAQE
ncbi:MAG: peptide chain release factor 1 [Deltaproteobacteria bacterium]|nr:peptide chain release factor 1 [Deltaproteobacteria bacterium]